VITISSIVFRLPRDETIRNMTYYFGIPADIFMWLFRRLLTAPVILNTSRREFGRVPHYAQTMRFIGAGQNAFKTNS